MKVLVVDDEFGLRQTLSLILGEAGHEVTTASNGEEALASAAGADLILCDIRMPVLDGLSFLDRYRAEQGRGLVIMMSAYGDDEAALEAMRHGAYDFIAKPFRADQVLLVLRKAIEREGLVREVAHLRETLRDILGDGSVIGRSAAIREVVAVATKAARHPSTVLITGESGTGKEVIARLLHERSPRAAQPFVAVNCGAIPDALLESELFGHAKGAFTGATSERQGLFEEAAGGTLFLDEIGEMPIALQVKLLRVLQEGEVRRVGDNKARSTDARVVAATARDLETEVAQGRFRGDLYYRINVVRLHLPPLRERREDIPELAKHFLALHATRLGVKMEGFTPSAMRALIDYAWPGNIRELENVVERAVVLAEHERVDLAHLPAVLQGAAPAPSSTAQDSLSVKIQTEALERTLIRRALDQTGGNRTKAAVLLDLSHRALLYKIREYGID